MKRDDTTIALAFLLIVLLGWTLFTKKSPSYSNDSVIPSGLASDSTLQVVVDSSYAGIIVYYPPTESIDLRCIEMPVPTVDTTIVFCCAAAFTGQGDKDHSNIAGDHVASGVRYQGYRCMRNTGAFIYYNGHWEFLYKEYSHMLDSAAAHSGTGFAQEMMIHEGVQVETTRRLEDINLYRALCQVDGRLCVVDSRDPISFGSFIQLLLEAGATEALYTDMGEGWNYSWYRDKPRGNATYIHSSYNVDATNWLVFFERGEIDI